MNDKIYTRNRLRLPKSFQKNKRIFSVMMVLIIAFSFAYFSLKAIEPIMEKNSKSMAKSVATKICNNEATKVMANYQYDDFLNITKDEKGNIQMVGTNIITVNEIISDIPVNIQEQMEKSENNEFSIRLGSFLGSNLFARKRSKSSY